MSVDVMPKGLLPVRGEPSQRFRARSDRSRTLARAVEIVDTICRHLARVLLEWAHSSLSRSGRTKKPGLIGAIELRDMLAELGPTFIKLGQVLSTRPDLVPPVFEKALATLQDSAPIVPGIGIRAVVHEAGLELDEAFASFDDEALAAASIGQVHAATLIGGREVVVKVRRPGVESLIELDLAILNRLARLVACLPGRLRRLDLVGFVEEFGVTIRAELDYLAEGNNADQIRPFLGALGIHVPAVIWTHTRETVLTLERIRGVKIDDLVAIEALDIDRKRLARTFSEAYLAMVFVNGFFHADPHPGNLFVEPSGRVAMVDFGMMGTVSPGLRRALVEILMALSTRDAARSARALTELGVVPGGVDEQRFASDLARLTRATIEVPVGELRLAPLLSQFMAVSRKHRLRFPRELALLVKTVVMCEGLAAQLDPGFSLSFLIGPFVASTFSASWKLGGAGEGTSC